MMFIWVIIIGVLIYIFIGNGTLKWDRHNNPMTLLDERLAKGEVTLEDYKKLKNEMKEL